MALTHFRLLPSHVQTQLPPTADEIAEYCRDPDSTGCDLDMVDALMAEADKRKGMEGGCFTLVFSLNLLLVF